MNLLRGLSTALLAVALAASSFIARQVSREAFDRPAHLNRNRERYAESADLIEWPEHVTPASWTVTSSDNVAMSGYWIRNQSNYNTVLLCHGHGSCALTLTDLGKAYYKDGYNVLLIDMRAHGLSGGKYSTLGWTERKDCQTWVDRLIQEVGPEVAIVAHGISMGANALLNAAGDGLPSQVKVIVSDSAFTTVWSILSFRLHKHKLPATPPLLAILGMNLHSHPRINLFASTTRQVQKSSIPILYIHGAFDDQNPMRMTLDLYKSTGGSKRLWVTSASGHGLSFQTDKEAYMEHVREFVSKNIG